MLLLDENISHKLVQKLNDTYANIKHIKNFVNTGSTDDTIWEIAKQNNLTILTFDADYEDLVSLHGFPPKIIWLRFGNASTNTIFKTLVHHQQTILEFIENETLGILEINEAFL